LGLRTWVLLFYSHQIHMHDIELHWFLLCGDWKHTLVGSWSV
jgi:hypothetical protein